MPVGGIWIPSGDEVSSLQDAAKAAQKEKAKLEVEQEEFLKKFSDENKEYERVSAKAAETKRQADLAQAFRLEEQRRLDVLPSLARMAQADAMAEHQKRLAAEAKLRDLREKVAQAKETDKSFDDIRAENTKQRLANRIRAAEHARIATAAKDAAEKARLEMRRKADCEKKENATTEAAENLRKEASEAAKQQLDRATAELTSRVTQTASQTVQEEQAVASASLQYDLLKKQAELSSAAAIEAQRLAYEERAKADAAYNLYDNYITTRNDAYAKAYTSRKEAAAAMDQVNETRAKAEASIAERTEVMKASDRSTGEALKILKSTANSAGEISAKAHYAADISEISPKSFISGVASGMKADNETNSDNGMTNLPRISYGPRED
jgi:hypothetical protein